MQSPEHSMPTHEHKQTHTNTHRHNAKQSHTPTRSLALRLLKWILLFPRLECLCISPLFSRLLMFDSRQGRGPNPRVLSRPLQALLRTIPPEQVGRGWKGLFFCQRNAQRGTISKTLYPWAQHQFLLIRVLSAVALFKQLAQMLMSSYLHIYFFLCWNVIDYYVLRWWMPLLMHSDM